MKKQEAFNQAIELTKTVLQAQNETHTLIYSRPEHAKESAEAVAVFIDTLAAKLSDISTKYLDD